MALRKILLHIAGKYSMQRTREDKVLLHVIKEFLVQGMREERFVARRNGVFSCRILSHSPSGLETWLGQCRESILVANTMYNVQFENASKTNTESQYRSRTWRSRVKLSGQLAPRHMVELSRSFEDGDSTPRLER
jgi:hypothetical protein